MKERRRCILLFSLTPSHPALVIATTTRREKGIAVALHTGGGLRDIYMYMHL